MKQSEVQDLKHSVEDLARLAKDLGYDTEPCQLILNNGCSVSGILNMFEDNPGMIQNVYEFVEDNASLYNWEDEEPEDEEEEDDS